MDTYQDNTPSEEGHESCNNIGNTEDATHELKSGEETTTSTGGEEPMDPTPQENKPSDSTEKGHGLPKPDITELDAAHTESETATANASHGEEKATVDKDAKPVPPCFSTKSSLNKEALLDHIRGTIYGNCIGDAIGLLTEFMTKEEATYIYSNYHEKSKLQKVKEMLPGHKKLPELEYSMKYRDLHRERFATGDWTDDSDQMILILLSLVANNGNMDPVDFAKRLKKWCKEGFKELGDYGGMGIGSTTHSVLRHPQFLKNPHEAATYVWEYSGRYLAPNGGVMRTSILGIHDFSNIDEVISNTMAACKVTHADPRCIASCVAVTAAVAIMLQGKHLKESGDYDIDAVISEAYEYASNTLETAPEDEELKKYMFAKSLGDLQLSESGKIGYTYKCMGAGFWSLRQDDFRAALEAIAYEGGDADTNGAVAGALLGCKLGASALPSTWLNGLKHKEWLDEHIGSFLALLGLNE